MKNTFLLVLAVLVLYGSAFAQLQAPGEDNTPAVGTMAPDYGLDGLQGETKVLLAFFPAAFTPG
jgi:peroxiredoxin